MMRRYTAANDKVMVRKKAPIRDKAFQMDVTLPARLAKGDYHFKVTVGNHTGTLQVKISPP